MKVLTLKYLTIALFKTTSEIILIYYVYLVIIIKDRVYLSLFDKLRLGLVMDNSRIAVSIRRQLIAMSLIANALIIWFVRWAMAGTRKTGSEGYGWPLQTDANSYPDWVVNGWLPLDFLVGTLMVYGLCHIMVEPEAFLSTILRGLVISFSVPGVMMGAVFVALDGWFIGLKAFVFSGLASVTLMLAIAVLIGVLLGAGWLVSQGYHRYLAPVLTPVLVPLQRFFTAQDIPEHSDPS
ncbi:MAG: hypothetical protein KA604_01580 [Candidatus Saccharimonas sp.]|jgi:hypothetical protein|nr:hypothetical protein [Candidatus Saccharimonas sp.]